jgi:YidC/Oxa1 family membrane protein insertase
LTASLSTAAQRILDEQVQAPVELASDITNGVAEYGEMAQVGLGITYWPSDLMIRLLEFCHVSTQLPWWASIVVLTVMLRVVLFPLMLKTTRNMSILPYIADKQKVLMEESKEARLSGEVVEMRKATMKLLGLYRQWGYSPFMSFWGILQIPIFFAMFRTCWRCSNLPVPGWETGGTAWFTDLTAIDPYFILPTISGVTTAVTIWVRALASLYTSQLTK